MNRTIALVLALGLAGCPKPTGIDVAAQRKKIAGDKFELIKQRNGMREPFSEQRKPGAWQT